ncbi:hypothetical protein EAG18_19860, partial [Pseudoalteromonas sp. J010]|uniref:hypothetical protein n=1 Tax=Pseudoalteromonas sp. J010 TaxID=998465 RepID=UPI000FAC90DF
SHPEKGSFSLYLMDDNDNGPDYYQADKKRCAQEVYARGVIINGEVVNDPQYIESFLETADEALEKAAINAIEAGKREVDEELREEILPHLGSIEFDEAVNEKMRELGWLTRMGTKADLN